MSLKPAEQEDLSQNKALAAPGGAYLVVLVGGDRDEGGLGEDVGAERRVLGAEGVVLVRLHNVQPRLVFVHGVQDDLKNNGCSSEKSIQKRKETSRGCWTLCSRSQSPAELSFSFACE